MRHQDYRRRDSKSFLIVDEDTGIPTSVVETYQAYQDNGPLAQSDLRSLLLSMSDNSKSQNYGVYDYSAATRSAQGQDYANFAAHQPYASSYVEAPSQMPSGLPQSASVFTPTTSGQQYGSHDHGYYAQQNVAYSGYVDATAAPRPLPEIVSYSPASGQVGTTVTVHLRSVYDFDLPQVTPLIMFGQKRCAGLLSRTPTGPPYQYIVTVDAPPLTPASPPSPQVSLSLTFDDSSVAWQSPSVEFGSFSYVHHTPVYSAAPSSTIQSKKRKLDDEASPRRSPTKKPSLHNLSASVSATATPTSPFRRPSAVVGYPPVRRRSGPEYQPMLSPGHSLRSTQSQHFYPTYTTNPPVPPMPAMPAPQNLAWNQLSSLQTSRSPSAATMAAGSKSSLLPSPAFNPALVRTTSLQQSPVAPGVPITTPQQFNPYTIYPANSKAMLKIDGDLNTMTAKWTSEEWDAGRRLVQFRRSQQGSVITATFEAVTLESRIPNSICVSCIYWAERGECFVTSVDTIALLEALVAVRFTVEEKNRIRRNLEGFRPMTVSKTKQDSEEFFKLIMGFPNPKPRNIEKDVKVFPWRILAGALKKIIGKYSASYSSTAGALHTPGIGGSSYSGSRASDSGIEQQQQQRAGASPLSTSSSATSHGHAYASNIAASYSARPSAPTGLGIIAGGITPSAAAVADVRLTMPASAQASNWQQQQHHAHQQPSPHHHYSNDVRNTTPWDLTSPFLHPSPAMGMSVSATTGAASGLPVVSTPGHQYTTNMPPLTMAPHHHPMPVNTRFVPLQTYQDGASQQTSHA